MTDTVDRLPCIFRTGDICNHAANETRKPDYCPTCSNRREKSSVPSYRVGNSVYFGEVPRGNLPR